MVVKNKLKKIASFLIQAIIFLKRGRGGHSFVISFRCVLVHLRVFFLHFVILLKKKKRERDKSCKKNKK